MPNLELVGYLDDVLWKVLIAEAGGSRKVAFVGAIDHEPTIVIGVLVLRVE